jgi:2-methylaconitate cis-trans-isomerase PrpF
MTKVRMHHLTSGAVLTGTVPTPGGRIPKSGLARVPGSTAAGVPVNLSFHSPWGKSTGSVLPTGNPVDQLQVDGRTLSATMVDAGAPAVLLPAEEAGVDLSSMTDNLAAQLPTLIAARASAGLIMGLRKPEDPPQNAVPKVGVVAPAGDYIAADGTTITAGSHDVRVRMLSMLAPHPAIGLTSAVAVALAASLPSSVVANAAGQPSTGAGSPRVLRIGTPAGVITADIISDDNGIVSEVALHRAARHIATADIDVAQPAELSA